MPEERTVAGIRCGEVLADLTSYVDGELAPERVAQIEAHLKGCNWCDEFGQGFAGVLAVVRSRLAEPEPVGDDVAARLMARLLEEP